MAEDAWVPLVHVAHGLGVMLAEQGEYDLACQLFEHSLAICCDSGDRDQEARELNSLGITHRYLGDLDTARALLEDSITITRETGNEGVLAAALCHLGQVESTAGNFDRATQALREALALDRKQDDAFGAAIDQQSLAVVSLRAGRAGDARAPLVDLIGHVADAKAFGSEVAAEVASDLFSRHA